MLAGRIQERAKSAGEVLSRRTGEVSRMDYKKHLIVVSLFLIVRPGAPFVASLLLSLILILY